MTAGQISDDIGAMALLSRMPKGHWFLADRGLDVDWSKGALKDNGIKVCIPAGNLAKRR